MCTAPTSGTKLMLHQSTPPIHSNHSILTGDTQDRNLWEMERYLVVTQHNRRRRSKKRKKKVREKKIKAKKRKEKKVRAYPKGHSRLPPHRYEAGDWRYWIQGSQTLSNFPAISFKMLTIFSLIIIHVYLFFITARSTIRLLM